MRRQYLLAALSTIAVGAIGWADVVTGPDYGMSLFYLAPVAVMAWFVGRRAGSLLALGAAIMWFVSEHRTRPEMSLVPEAWNGFTRLVIYTGCALLLGVLRADRNRMRELLASAEQVARTDALTQLANSRAFYERLNDETARLARYRRSITIVYIDIDNFKRVNDRFGHAKGDELLTEIAAVLRGIARSGDVAARLGGDEFAVALWETTPDQVREFETRLASSLEPVVARYPDTGLGASVGFAELSPEAKLDDVLRAADQAMYAAKAARKSRTAPRATT